MQPGDTPAQRRPAPPPPEQPEPPPQVALRVAMIAWIPGIALLVGLVWLVFRHLAEEREIAMLFAHAEPWWLGVAVLLQVLTYFTVGESWRAPLAAGGHPFPRPALARLSMLKLTLDQAIPTGGVSGTILAIHRLRQAGVEREVLGATLLIVVAGYYFAYAAGVLLALAVLWKYRSLGPVVASVAIVFAFAATLVPPFLIWAARRAPARMPKRLRNAAWLRDLVIETEFVSPVLIRSIRLYLIAAGGSFATMVLDAATLAATMAAVGADPGFPACFAALVMASVAATIGVMPGGLGTFESASVGVLTLAGMSPTASLSGTLLLRGLTFWLPMIPGAIMLRRPPKAGERSGGALHRSQVSGADGGAPRRGATRSRRRRLRPSSRAPARRRRFQVAARF